MKFRSLLIASGVVLATAACEPPPVVGMPDPSTPSSESVPAASSSAGTPVPASIDATGQQDVTAALTSFFASLPAGSTVQFPAGAQYRIEGTVVVSGAADLTIEGNGARLFATTDGSSSPAPAGLTNQWPRHRAHLYVTQSSDVTIRDLVIQGPHRNGGTSEPAYVARYEAQHAIELDRVSGALVEGNDLSRIYGDGVTVARGSSDVVIRDNDIHHNGRQGVAVTGGTNITIQGNRFDQIRRSVVDVEPNSSYDIQTVRILDNHVTVARLSFVAALGRGDRFDDLEIAGNHLERMALEIQVKYNGPRRTNIHIHDNVSAFTYGSTVAAIQLWGVDGATITNNTQPLTAGRRQLLVEAKQSCFVDVHGNTVPLFRRGAPAGTATEVRVEPFAYCERATPPAAPVR